MILPTFFGLLGSELNELFSNIGSKSFAFSREAALSRAEPEAELEAEDPSVTEVGVGESPLVWLTELA